MSAYEAHERQMQEEIRMARENRKEEEANRYKELRTAYMALLEDVCGDRDDESGRIKRSCPHLTFDGIYFHDVYFRCLEELEDVEK
jgi:hypothetical protein